MSLLSAIGLGKNNSTKTNSQTSNVTDITTPVSVGGDNSAPIVTAVNSSGASFNFLDGGAIGRAFDFADQNTKFADRSRDAAYDFADTQVRAGNDAAAAATKTALTKLASASASENEKAQTNFMKLAAGFGLVVVVIAFITRG